MLQGIAKKYKEIKIIKNPTDLHPTFVLDHVEAIKEHYYDNQRGDAKYDKNQKLVEKARRESARDSKINFRNKSKSATSKQNHSPVHE